ncbi:flagellar biosynthesis anti-sigma factor FlgM [Aneurinibacillus tyrosinisolvens]|uniref:flagellar biosynthesis anti-sigma factor FlgM n=1 Tax=Aneurinibacillus tyrosinisolvens TaxID=1443435 RepID=UPI0009E21C97|nr:flagellar biosynthesis anti-sigma factor FlgM [Aneurinibacillus tyrosinisolvens]
MKVEPSIRKISKARIEHLAKLKKQVKDGTYHVSAASIADKMTNDWAEQELTGEVAGE